MVILSCFCIQKSSAFLDEAAVAIQVTQDFLHSMDIRPRLKCSMSSGGKIAFYLTIVFLSLDGARFSRVFGWSAIQPCLCLWAEHNWNIIKGAQFQGTAATGVVPLFHCTKEGWCNHHFWNWLRCMLSGSPHETDIVSHRASLVHQINTKCNIHSHL